jgi:hypothetical protein
MNALLSGVWVESASGVVRVEQSVTAVKALLRFLYTDKVDEEALGLDLVGVLELAAMHGQDELVLACEHHALQSLTVDGAADAAALADLYNLSALKAASLEIIETSG